MVDSDRRQVWRSSSEAPYQSNRGGQSPAAERTVRIVDVAEALGISPDLAKMALEREDGEIRTDVPLSESIGVARKQLDMGP